MVVTLESFRYYIMANPANNESESVDGWLQWIHNCVCILEDTWTSADIQLQLSVYLLTGVVVLWLLIGIAWWKYGEAISNLFELRNGSMPAVQDPDNNLASSSSEFIAPWQDHSFVLSPETQKLTKRIKYPQT